MTRTILTFISFILLFSTSTLKAQNDENEDGPTFEALIISGIITAGEDALDSVQVDLYEMNSVVESFLTRSNGKFKFRLQNDKIYTIDLIKEGYYTKRISVNTKLSEDYKGKYSFDFDINLDSKSDKKYDPQLVEYPSALISFDERDEEFSFDRGYTRSYFDENDRYHEAMK